MHTESKPVYGENYFLNGQKLGLSNYTNYSWKPEQTIPFAQRVIDVLGIQVGQSLLDFGCSRGYLVKALRMLYVSAYGYDISEWAIANCDPAVKDFVGLKLPDMTFDYIVAKDVLEHLEAGAMAEAVVEMTNRLRNTMLIVVPLGDKDTGRYVRDEDNADITHEICWQLETWLEVIDQIVPRSFAVSASWRYPGIKPAANKYPKSCGFLFIRRL